MLDFHFSDPSSNSAEAHSFYRTGQQYENKEKDDGVSPLKVGASITIHA